MSLSTFLAGTNPDKAGYNASRFARQTPCRTIVDHVFLQMSTSLHRRGLWSLINEHILPPFTLETDR